MRMPYVDYPIPLIAIADEVAYLPGILSQKRRPHLYVYRCTGGARLLLKRPLVVVSSPRGALKC